MRTDDRFQFLRQFAFDEPGVDGRRFFVAYVDCLSPAEVCALLDPGFWQRPEERQALLNRLVRDLASGVGAHHVRLFDEVLDRLPGLLYKQQEQAYVFLFTVLAWLPPEARARTLDLALDSSRRRQRARGFAALAAVWDPRFEPRVLRILAQHGDFAAASLAVQVLSVEQLFEHRALLEPLVERSRAFNQLYLRLASLQPEVVEPLRGTHPVTYAVLRTHLGRALSEDEALQMYTANQEPRLSYLYLWCFGRMGLWTVVATIHALERSERRQERLVAAQLNSDLHSFGLGDDALTFTEEPVYGDSSN